MKKPVKKYRELPAGKLRWRCPESQFDFKTTETVKPCKGIIGQDRALLAIKMGLELEHRGYNIFITGLVGTGRMTTIKHLLEQLEKKGPIPPDICYMNNFKNPNMPTCLELEAGKGLQIRSDMDHLVHDLKDKIPAVFQSDYYKKLRKKRIEAIQAKQKKIVTTFEEKIGSEGFAMVRIQMGAIVKPDLLPVVDGNPANFGQLAQRVEEGTFPAEQFEKLQAVGEKLSEEMAQVYQELKKLEKELRDALEKLDIDTVNPIVQELIQEIALRYNNEKLTQTLQQVEENLMQKLDLFRSQEEEEGGSQGSVGAREPDVNEDPFREFRVNVVVDNSDTKAPLVIIENFPTVKNMFGIIERQFTPTGWLKGDHMSIRAGSFHRANGGYLVVNALDVFIEPGVWQTLKRTLKSAEAVIQSYDPFSLIGSSALKPEPMQIKAKIVLIGDAYLYYLLQIYDEDFRKIFKIRADFDQEVDNRKAVLKEYAGFVKAMCEKENIACFDRSGVAAVVEYGVRLAGRQNKISTRFSEIADMIREAHYHAREAGSTLVKREHVAKAHSYRIKRVNLIEEKIQERIDEGTLMIDTAGAVVGQVNGLSVYNLGDYMFGRPSRITARTGLGDSGVINIEREADLSGPAHNKGVLILSGYIRGRYGENHPIAMSASLCFEQSYGGVDGDSASSTELYAILSSLTELPIRQDIAVTGSINQKGEIQPIGGVNEKIEGFFKVCKARRLKGTEGVIIPHQNVPDLMLDEEVVEAARKGKFHIYPVETVDQGIEILTGVPAGKKLRNGDFTKDAVNDRVQRRLIEMASAWREYGAQQRGKK
ncbi:MAG TPA: ATP-binding protein [Patescibacteria group bacterium]|nr:ATP-binding protein [Patescibacteria group bacterium]